MDSIVVENLVITYKPLAKTDFRKRLRKGFQKAKPFVAVDHVSFSVRKGEVLGLIGKNGSGKSTLLRSMAGIFSPDSGKIDIGNQSISLLALGAGFLPEMTGRKNIYISGLLLGFTKKEIEAHEQEIIDFAEIGNFIDMPVKTYSSGMYSKLAFAITAVLETNIMLIDEILSVGDEKFKTKSFNKMKELISNKEKTVMVVSHNMNQLLEICDRVMWLHEGKIMKIGDPEKVIAEYQEFMRK